MGKGLLIDSSYSVPEPRAGVLHDPDPESLREPVRRQRSGGRSITWWPRSGYAARLIEDSGSIGIALDTGFSSGAHLSRRFRADWGVAPAHFRRDLDVAERS